MPRIVLLALLAALTVACASAPAEQPPPIAPTSHPIPDAPTAAPTPEPTPEPTAEAADVVPGSQAEALLRATEASLPRWADVEVAGADGFVSIGDAITGHEHYIHWDWALDDVVLDAERPESLVYRVLPDGGRELVSAMYALPPGATMADVPDLGDPQVVWHTHDNLCWEGRRVAGIVMDGECVPGGEPRETSPMLHVWIVEHPCGPFAGLEGHGVPCATLHRH